MAADAPGMQPGAPPRGFEPDRAVERGYETAHPADDAYPSLGTTVAAVTRMVLRSPLTRLAAVLLLIDFAFIAIQIAAEASDYAFRGSFSLGLEKEHGAAEIYGYAQSFGVAVLLLLAWRRWRNPVACFWAGLYLFVLLDDALLIHERAGSAIADFGVVSIASLRAQDVGELTFYALLGSLALTALLAVERRHPPGPRPSTLTRLMLPVTGLLFTFAVVIDAAASTLPFEAALEDGGELIVLSLALLVSVAWARRPEMIAALLEPSD